MTSVGTQAALQPQSGWAETVRGAKRDAILTAAREVFGQDGLEGATMRQIALRAGCTTGAIYPLFASKEIIYAELLASSLSDLHAHVRQAFDQPTTNAQASRHAAAAHAFLAYYLARPYEVNLGLYAFNGLKQTGVGKQDDQTLNQALTQTLLLLAPHRSAGKPRRPNTQAMCVFAQLIGTLVLHQAGRLKPGRHQPQALIAHYLQTQHIAENQETDDDNSN